MWRRNYHVGSDCYTKNLSNVWWNIWKTMKNTEQVSSSGIIPLFTTCDWPCPPPPQARKSGQQSLWPHPTVNVQSLPSSSCHADANLQSSSTTFYRTLKTRKFQWPETGHISSKVLWGSWAAWQLCWVYSYCVYQSYCQKYLNRS